MADIAGAFFRGQQAGQAQLAHKQALEDNKIRMMVLKHQMDAIKIDDQIRARKLAQENAAMMQGQPAADLPQEAVSQPNLPSTSYAGAMSGLPGDQAPTTFAAPAAQEMQPQMNDLARRVAPLQIPGVEALGVPGVSIRPQSLEDLMAAQRRAELQKLLVTKFAPGEVVPALGSEPPAGPRTRTAIDLAMAAAGGDPAKAFELSKTPGVNPETVRHNKAMEAANNPLAVLTGGGTGAPIGVAGPAGLTGPDFLQSLPANIASEVKAYAEGRRPFPAGFALKSPYFQSLIQMVGQYDPTFDAVNYNARSKTRSDFTSGKSAQTINALNTVTQHLDRLSGRVDRLNNSWSPTYNSIANFLSRQSGSKVVTDFETDKKAVVDELTRTWRQSGGSEQDIKSWSAVLDAANSPEQLHGAIAEMGHLLEGKLLALEDQYRQGMGAAPERPVVTPASRAALTKLERKAGLTPTMPDQAGGGMIEALDPQGNVHHAPAGTPLPPRWRLK